MIFSKAESLNNASECELIESSLAADELSECPAHEPSGECNDAYQEV